MSDKMDRRELFKKAGQVGIAVMGMGILSQTPIGGMVGTADAASSTIVVAQKGKSIVAKVFQAVEKLGGMGQLVKKGAKVVIKPNIAWSRTPEQAANTHPDVVEGIIQLCQKAGAGSITIYEHTCDSYATTFGTSGIQAVADKYGVKLVSCHEDKWYKSISIPKAKTLKSAQVIKPLAEADCYINAPIAKVHSSGVVTLCLKNQMGIVSDRGYFHVNGLHQCIADLATAVRPHLCILDATRMLLTGGPKGPGKVKEEGKVIAGTDMVAVDAYGASLLGYKPENIEHIKTAAQFGLGQMDLSKVNIITI